METPDDIVGPLNLGNPGGFTIRELAEMVIGLTGPSSRIIHHPLPADDPRQRRPDISKAQELLEWQPKTPLLDGLMKTIDYLDQLLSGQRAHA